MIARMLLALMLLGVPIGAWAGDRPYDDKADARQTIQSAVDEARASHKLVLIDFGANWCPDCRALDTAFHNGDLAHLISDGFVVAHVNVGRFDKNLDVAKTYGNPIEKGIPAVVVTKPDGTVVYTSKTGALADARHMDDKSLTAVFQAILQSK